MNGTENSEPLSIIKRPFVTISTGARYIAIRTSDPIAVKPGYFGDFKQVMLLLASVIRNPNEKTRPNADKITSVF